MIVSHPLVAALLAAAAPHEAAPPAAAALDSPPAVAATLEDRCPQEAPVEPNRRVPGIPPAAYEPASCDPQRLPAPSAAFRPESIAVPDRWRIVNLLPYEPGTLSPFYRELLRYQRGVRDPYAGNNVLKGDRPAFGENWFFSLTAISDTVIEPRRFPVPVGIVLTERADSLDTFGR
ncbi:MAG: hypothetical protein NZM12_10505, partial [Steroidobacteraceae bacterium]|nr:hypothetical protein [Steroidobacteraceae bacterium]MDW8260123.1 hypothetical protein [Gammaproteobacteria bacterium]